MSENTDDSESRRRRWREHELIGHTLFRDRRYDEAFVHFNEAVELSPSDPELLYSRGTTLGWMGYYDDAISDLNEAIRLKPDFKEARIGLSSSLAWRDYYRGKR